MSNIIDKLGLKQLHTIIDIVEIEEINTGNHMYIHTRMGRKQIMFKKPEVKRIQESIIDQLSYLRDDIPQDFTCFTILVLFVFNNETFLLKYEDSLRKIDLTNLYKPIEDGICKALEIDDSKSVRNYLRKHITNEESPPYTIIFKIDFYGR